MADPNAMVINASEEAPPGPEMSDVELIGKLQAAHEAGDTEGAQVIADIIHSRGVDHSHVPDPKDESSGGNDTNGDRPGSPLADGSGHLQIFNPFGKNFETPIPLHANVENTLAGAGKSLTDMGRGVGQMLGAESRSEVSDSRQRDAALMATKAGKLGDFGMAAATMAPSMWIPGAATAPGMAIIGGLNGLAQPSTSTSETLGNTALGAALPAGLKMVGRGINAASQKLFNMTPAGAAQRARELYTQYLGGDTERAAAEAHLRALAQKHSPTPLGGGMSPLDIDGYTPTTAQALPNAGAAQVERSLRLDPNLAPRFNARDAANNGHTNDLLTGISGTPEARALAEKARADGTRDMYRSATQDPEHFVPMPTEATPSIDQAAAAMPGQATAGLNDTGVRLQNLMQRPSMKRALQAANDWAREDGVTNPDARNLIQQLHYAKTQLDHEISQATGNPQRLLLNTKRELMEVMDKLSPAYASARARFTDLSKPINRMDVGEAMRRRYASGLADFGGTGSKPSSFADALRNGDTVAQGATDFGGATLAGTVGKQGVRDLHSVAEHLGRQQQAQNLGRGVGSNTAQNLNSESLLAGAGDPFNETVDAAGKHLIGYVPFGSKFADRISNDASARIKESLARAALDPHELVNLLNIGNSRTQNLLRYLQKGNHIPHATGQVMLNANRDQDAMHSEGGYADGGSVDDGYKKSSFWDLVKQAYTELTSSDEHKPTDAAPDDGLAGQAAKSLRDRYATIDSAVDAASQ